MANSCMWMIRSSRSILGDPRRRGKLWCCNPLQKFQLHELDKVLGGMLCLPATADTIASFIAEADSAPNELSTILNIMTAPPMPFLPADVHGKVIIMAMMVYAGDIEVGEQVISKFRSIATPYADMIRPMTYPEMFPPEEGGDIIPSQWDAPCLLTMSPVLKRR